jgi:3-isopropylmalate/(R)-2-methylmalate dehydratase small subunit
MKPLSDHTGRMVPLDRSDVDTDQIIPSDYCRRLSKTGFSEGLFGQWRRDPGFVLNQPEYEGASVLVARRNFGTGSSREPAVWALHEWGFEVVIAESFGDIFRRNALKNGLLAIQFGVDAVTTLLACSLETLVTVDLVAQEVRCGELTWAFEIDSRARWLLLNGLDEIDETLTKEADIARYEQGRRYWLVEPLVAGGTG